MALLWMDGFDHYDGLRANLLLGAYSSVGSQVQLITSPVRTGSHALTASSTAANSYVSWSFPSVREIFGSGFGFYAESADSAIHALIDFRNSGGGINCTLWLTPSGAFQLRLGSSSGGTLLLETDPCITYGAWNHVEYKIRFHNTDGYCHIRVNETPVTISSGSATSIDTVNTATAECAIIRYVLDSSPRKAIDDLFIWDTSGSLNNDFLGDRKVVTLNPNDNTSVNEWTETGAASPVQAINTTNDGDTSYITASDSVPVTSEFELANPDGSVGAIAGLMSVVVARKVESGTAIISPQMVVSSSSTSDGDHSISDEYTYYHTVHETNPATGLPWSPAALASARLRLRRTT